MKDLNTRLLAGHIITFDNPEFHEVEIVVEFRHDLPEWANGFKITMNGALIHSSKGFASFEKKLLKLINEWDLVEM